MTYTCTTHLIIAGGNGRCWKCEAEEMTQSSGWCFKNGIAYEGDRCPMCSDDDVHDASGRAASLADKPDAASMLRKAADLIEQRGKQRDREDGEKSMASTVNAFNAIYGTSLTEVQGWHFMELLKMVRSAYGEHVEDDYLDKIAYAALAGEAANAATTR